jgi:hypothetical protein
MSVERFDSQSCSIIARWREIQEIGKRPALAGRPPAVL